MLKIDLSNVDTEFDKSIMGTYTVSEKNSEIIQKMTDNIESNCVKDEFLTNIVTEFLDTRFRAAFKSCEAF